MSATCCTPTQRPSNEMRLDQDLTQDQGATRLRTTAMKEDGVVGGMGSVTPQCVLVPDQINLN